MIFSVIIGILGLIIIITAIMAVKHKNLKVAVLSAGIVSLMASVLYAIIGAPDLALTEASIGSAITTFIFFVALKKIAKVLDDDKDGI